MDAQPRRQDDRDRDRTISGLLASEAFTAFMTLHFDAAVRRAVDEQLALGVTQPR